MKISVIIPTIHPPERLLPAVEGLMEQRVPKGVFLELLIVLNGIEGIISGFPKDLPVHGPSVRFIKEPREGLVNARHRGAMEAGGDILVFLDDDAVPMEGWLFCITELFKDSSVHLAGGKVIPRFLADPPAWVDLFWQEDEVGRWMYHLSLVDLGEETREIPPQYIFGCNYAIRREVLFDCSGFNPDAFPEGMLRYRGDGEFGLAVRIGSKGYRAFYHPGITVQHLVPPGRLTERYFCYRSFLQGISDSFTHIRSSGGPSSKSPVNMERIRQAQRFWGQIKETTWRPGHWEGSQIRWWAEYSRQQGFWWHQGQVMEDPYLLEYVMRHDYWTPAHLIEDPGVSPEIILRGRAQGLFEEATSLYGKCRANEALSLLDQAMYWDSGLDGLQYLRALCLIHLGRVFEASLLLPHLRCSVRREKEVEQLECMLERARGLEGILSVPTRLTFNERMLLLELASQVPRGGVIVEVGSYLGGSTGFLAEGAKGRDVRIFCVDTWLNDAMTEGSRDTFCEFLENTRSYSEMITPLRGRSVDVGRGFQHQVDLLFIDADHSYEACREDLSVWLKHMKAGGILVLHDYGWAEGVRRAVREVIWPEDLKSGSVVDSTFWTRLSGGSIERAEQPGGYVNEAACEGPRRLNADEFQTKVLETVKANADGNPVDLSWVDDALLEPEGAVIYLTERCNSRCRTCNSWRLPQVDPLDEESWSSILDQIRRGGSRRLELVGGEPLLRGDLVELVQEARLLGFEEVIVSTNGLLLNAEKAGELLNAGVTQFHVSLDGTKETYQFLRGVDGFHLVLRALELLYERNVPTLVLTNLARQNIGELERILALCQFYGAKWFPYLIEDKKYLFKGVEIGDFMIRGPLVQSTIETLSRIIQRYPHTCTIGEVELRYIHDYLLDTSMERNVPCTLGFRDIYLDPRGDVFSACMSMDSVGNLLEEPIEEILQGRALRRNLKRMLLRRCPGCTCGYSQRAVLWDAIKRAGQMGDLIVSNMEDSAKMGKAP
jgi:MoaA/NifB/PqqE/SkfB family radical SAM enzyme/predicted O-methyltransferase YrrM/glycosyltransferase involved in cell wall biosynthesis